MGVGNINTRRDSGAESTSTLTLVEFRGRHQVSVDTGGDLASVVSVMVAKALKDKRVTRETTVDPARDLSSTVFVLVAKALKDKLDTKGTGCGMRLLAGKSTAPIPPRTVRALPSGMEMCTAPCTIKEQTSIGVTSKYNREDTSNNCRKTKVFACLAIFSKG